jgi:hypothetical protein
LHEALGLVFAPSSRRLDAVRQELAGGLSDPALDCGGGVELFGLIAHYGE